jgi:uncharacterized protein with gpF-like domain
VTVRAIHANAGVHAWYYEQLVGLIAEMAGSVETEIIALYGSLVAPPTIAADANPSILLKNALKKWGGLWVSRFDKLSLELASKFARKNFSMTQTQMKAAFKDAGFTVKFQPTPSSMAAYQAVVAEQVNLIKSIPQQYLKDVQTHVWQSVAKGGDLQTLKTKLRETYDITDQRAALISRDQNNKAKATIERARRQELGVTHAIWQHSAGGKVPRKSHVELSGKAYPLSSGAWDKDAKQYVLPGELINCRCVSKAVIPAFEDVETAEARGRMVSPLLRAAAARAR